MTEHHQNQWFLWLCAIESATCVWLAACQLIYASVQKVSLFAFPTIAAPALVIFALFCSLMLISPTFPARLKFALYALELAAISSACVFGAVAGFQFLLLIVMAKVALTTTNNRRWFDIGIGVSTVVCYVIFAFPNQHLFIQSVPGIESPTNLVGLVLSREVVPFALSAFLILKAVASIRSEQVQRQVLEALSVRLAAITSELERLRVVTELESSVAELISETAVFVRTATSETESERKTAAIAAAQQTSDRALQTVRRALKVLRD